MSARNSPVIVFDLDGTLADTAPDLIDVLNTILAPEGCGDTQLSEARELIGAGMKTLIERALAKHGRAVSSERLEELYQEFLQHYEKNICNKTTLFPGVFKALSDLQKKKYHLAVCTNKTEKLSVELLQQLKIDSFFSAICGRDTFPFFKPDPRHLLSTVEKAGGNNSCAVMVGDSQTDIVTAQAADIPVIAVPFGYTTEPVENFRPTRIIQHFDKLLQAVEDVLGTHKL